MYRKILIFSHSLYYFLFFTEFVDTEEEFKRTLTEHAKELAIQQSHPSRLRGNSRPSVTNAMDMFGSVSISRRQVALNTRCTFGMYYLLECFTVIWLQNFSEITKFFR